MTWSPRHPRHWRPDWTRCQGQRWSRAAESGQRCSGRWSLSFASHSPPAREARPLRSVLIVDDDDFGRETLGQILEATGYRALRAANGSEALVYLGEARRPELIILDLLMPRRDDFQLLGRLRHDPNLAGIPVIVVSAADPSALRRRCPGIVACFQKPVTVATLLAAIHRHLAR